MHPTYTPHLRKRSLEDPTVGNNRLTKKYIKVIQFITI